MDRTSADGLEPSMTTQHEQQTTATGPRTGRPPGRGSRERHPVVTLIVALLVGTAATAAGAGIGIRYLQKTGLSLGTVVGLVLLAVGLVALGYAVRSAWALLHGWWRLVLLPAGLVLLPVLFSTALAVMFTVVPPTTLGAGTPADEGLDYRDVTFETPDGVTQSGWFVPSSNGSALVVRHGSGSTRTATLDQAGVLGQEGYGLLLVDARGHGLSEGRGMDLGWYGDQDIIGAVDFLAEQPGVDPTRIGLLGLSMGGEEAVGAAAADPRIKAVVAEGVTGRTAADRDQWLPGGAAGTCSGRWTRTPSESPISSPRPRRPPHSRRRWRTATRTSCSSRQAGCRTRHEQRRPSRARRRPASRCSTSPRPPTRTASKQRPRCGPGRCSVAWMPTCFRRLTDRAR